MIDAGTTGDLEIIEITDRDLRELPFEALIAISDAHLKPGVKAFRMDEPFGTRLQLRRNITIPCITTIDDSGECTR